jgi:ParB-like nuclease domain
MNLFDNIFNPVNSFLGKQPSQVPVVSPQAPRTAQYVQPKAPVVKPSMTLFSDENEAFQKMKQANIQDEQAYWMLKKRRMDLLWGNDISEEEKSALQSMRESNIPSDKAVSMIQQRRKDQFQKKYDEWNLLQKGAYNALSFAAGNLETVAKYGGNTLDFITGGTMWFWDEVNKMEQVTQSPEFDSMAFKAGTYLPDVALGVSPIGGGYLAGAKGMTGLQGANLFSKIGAKNLSQWLMGRSAVVGAGFGASTPILNEWSDATMGDIATGAWVGAVAGAVATPVIAKALKYGQAGYRGGLTGMGKSISRDIKGGVQAITPSGANISTRANRFNALDEQKFIQATKQTPGEFATSRGMTKVGDDAVTESTNLWQASKDQADQAFWAIQGKFRIWGDKDFINWALEWLQWKLSKYSPEIERVNILASKYQNEGLTMSEVNELKRLYASNHKYSFLDSGGKQAIESRDIQDGLRSWQFKVAEENGLTNIADINRTTQAWKMYADSLAKKQNRSVANNANSLTDWIVLWGGSPENIALYLGKKLASSDTVKRWAIKLFSKQTKPSIIQANVADIQQSNFQKNVNRGVSGVGDSSGGKSMVRPVGLLPAASKEAIQAQEASLAKGVAKKQSTEQAKKILKAEQANKEALRSPDITTESKILRPSTPQKNVPKKLETSGKLRTNDVLTESEYQSAIKWAKSHEESNKLAMEAGTKKIDASNIKLYSGKSISYERNGKNYSVEFDKDPSGFLVAKDLVESYKVPHKIVAKPLVQVTPKSGEVKATKDALGNWKPTKWGYTVSDIDISKTNAFPSAKYHKTDYTNTASYKYWLEKAKKWESIPPIVVEKTSKWYNVVDGYHRLAAMEDAGIKNVKAVILDTPIIKWPDAKWVQQFTKFTDKEIESIIKPKPLSNESKKLKKPK